MVSFTPTIRATTTEQFPMIKVHSVAADSRKGVKMEQFPMIESEPKRYRFIDADLLKASINILFFFFLSGNRQIMLIEKLQVQICQGQKGLKRVHLEK